MNKNMDYNDDDDYKTMFSEIERLRQVNSIVGWIYIGLDIRFDNMTKIGLTTGQLGTRASGSQNPFYTLLCAFKIKEGVAPEKITEIESAVINLLSNYYVRIPHETTGRLSEWFYVNPFDVREMIHDFLYEKYNWYMYSYNCYERNIGIIYSWENNKFLHGASRSPYQAIDLSSPLVDSGCFMPGGCGADCDCWD